MNRNQGKYLGWTKLATGCRPFDVHVHGKHIQLMHERKRSAHLAAREGMRTE
jgi:hypothetical protein